MPTDSRGEFIRRQPPPPVANMRSQLALSLTGSRRARGAMSSPPSQQRHASHPDAPRPHKLDLPPISRPPFSTWKGSPVRVLHQLDLDIGPRGTTTVMVAGVFVRICTKCILPKLPEDLCEGADEGAAGNEAEACITHYAASLAPAVDRPSRRAGNVARTSHRPRCGGTASAAVEGVKDRWCDG